MNKINIIFKKNLKVLLKNKFSWFVLFMGPIFIILIMGFLFNNQNSYNINVGIHSDDSSDMYLSYVDNLKNDNFKIIDYSSKDLCLDSIKKGLVHVCIFFPDDFDLNSNKTNLVEIKLDSSKNNLVTVVNNLVVNSLDDKSKIYQMDNTDALIEVVYNSEINSMKNKVLILQLNESVEIIRKNNKMLENNMVSIKSKFNIDNFDIEKIVDKVDSVQSIIIDYVNTGQTQLSIVKTNLNNLSVIASGSVDIDNHVNDIDDAILKINLTLNSMNSIYSLKSLDAKINDLEEDMMNIESIINELSMKVNELIEDNKNEIVKIENMILNLNDNNNLILSEISDVKIRDSDNIVKPIEVEISSISENENYLSPLIPTLLVSLSFIISIILSSNLVLMEKQSRANFRNFMTQSTSFDFILGNFLSLCLIIFMQFFLIMIVYFIMVQFNLDLFLSLILIIPVIFVFIFLGMLIGNLSNSHESNLILSFITIFAIFAFSGLMLPVELLSENLLRITNLNPYLVSESMFRKFLLFAGGFSEIIYDLLILGIYIIILFLLNIMIESFNKKRSIYKLCHEIELKLVRSFRK